MSNRRTEESVRRAFGNAAPNNLKEVMGKCEEQKGRVIILENTAKRKAAEYSAGLWQRQRRWF